MKKLLARDCNELIKEIYVCVIPGLMMINFMEITFVGVKPECI